MSYRRRVLRGRIGLVRAEEEELVPRGGVALSRDELACVLVGGGGSI